MNTHWTGTKGKPSERINDPTALSPAELKLYNLIKNGEKRVEQEKIPAKTISEGTEQLNMSEFS